MITLITADVVAFWVCAPIAVLAGLGVVLMRKPVHSAVCMAAVMVSLAVLYAAQNAPFLFVVQIIVYTGAILMLFLFVVMLVGVDTTDSVVETLKGHRAASVVGTVGVAGLLLMAVGQGVFIGHPAGLESVHDAGGGNLRGLAALLFTRYVFIFEATAALLITAAVGAMVLAHGERLRERKSQVDSARERVRAYADEGVHPGPLPNSGVFARHNAIHVPALLPDGSVSEKSISKTLADRGVIVEVDSLRRSSESAYKVIEYPRASAEGEVE